MEPGGNPYAAGIVALALAFHRAPAQHPDLLHGRVPLPAGVDTLLKLAGGSAPDPHAAALAPPDQLRAAALFFVEQVLLHHDASHYRMLGLEPGASTGQIKEHHRLLMRMFHPDRERHADDWKDAFATRINLAYTSLHDPQARRRYDATLKPAAQPGLAPLPVRRAVAPHTRAVLGRRGLPPMLLHYLPQWVLAGTALLALVVVGSVYVNNPPPPVRLAASPPLAVPGGQSAASRVAEKSTVAAAATPRPPAESAQPSQPSGGVAPAIPAVVPADDRPGAPALQPAPIPAQNRLPAVSPQAEPPRPPTAARTLRNPATAVAARAEPAPPAQPREKPAEIGSPATLATEVAAHPLPLDPSATLAQFLSSFERGDTPAFMALFDEVAIGKAGGKSQIRQEHESLFRSTDLRHIAIDDMAWAQEGDWMRGEGRYRTTLMRKGEQKLQTETGTIRIELLRRGDHALIMGLDYLPGERS